MQRDIQYKLLQGFVLATLLTCSMPTFSQQAAKVRINHLALHVAHLGKSEKFYREVIGLQAIPEPFADGKHAWFDMGGGAQLHLIEAGERPVIPLKHTHLCFSVPSIPTFTAHLEALKIPFEDWPGKPGAITTRPDGVRQIYLRDPDGFWLEINDDQAK